MALGFRGHVIRNNCSYENLDGHSVPLVEDNFIAHFGFQSLLLIFEYLCLR